MCEIQLDPLQCRGHTDIPRTWEELKNSVVDDEWNMNIQCVINGLKKVAVTDYDSFTDIDDRKEYFENVITLESHLEMIEKAKQCGIGLIVDEKGTHYFYSQDAQTNAELLMRYGFRGGEKLPKGIKREIYRSLLMGYSNLSIILYQMINMVYQTNMEDLDDYDKTVKKYIKKYTPKIERVREYLLEQGASLFKD